MVIIFSGVSIFGSQAQTFSDGNGGSMEVTTDGEYIYLEYSGSWTNYIQQIFDISVNGQTAPGHYPSWLLTQATMAMVHRLTC